MDTSQDRDTATQVHVSLEVLAENVIEVEVDFSAKANKECDPTGIPEVLKAEIALRNTNGGVIKLKLKSNLAPHVAVQSTDKWRLKLNKKWHAKLLELGTKESLAEILDYELKYLLIFVRKSSIILTEKSNLLERRGTEKYALQNYFEIHNMLEKKNMPLECCCTHGETQLESFELGRQMPFSESVTVEYKLLTSERLPKALRGKLKDYVVEFANTCGGYMYFGISDNAIIKGQKIRNERERSAIFREINNCMKSKIWVGKSGFQNDPVEGDHYHVGLFPVVGAQENTFVITVHICQYAGTVFLKPPECIVVNEENQYGHMTFEKWLSSFLNTSTCSISKSKSLGYSFKV
jgi:hypothetical protein